MQKQKLLHQELHFCGQFHYTYILIKCAVFSAKKSFECLQVTCPGY